MPPANPTIVLIDGWLIADVNPNVSARTNGTSAIICPVAQANPERAPPSEPCNIIPKVKGPGARAPDAVTITTVPTKSNKFTRETFLQPEVALNSEKGKLSYMKDQRDSRTALMCGGMLGS